MFSNEGRHEKLTRHNKCIPARREFDVVGMPREEGPYGKTTRAQQSLVKVSLIDAAHQHFNEGPYGKTTRAQQVHSSKKRNRRSRNAKR